MASEDYTRDSARTYGRTWPRTVAEPSLFLNFTSATALDPRITFSRGSQATLFDSTGTLRYAKQNLLLQSQALTTSPWITTSLSAVGSKIAPDGTATAIAITATGANGRTRQPVTVVAGQTYTHSMFVRRVTGSGSVTLAILDSGGTALFSTVLSLTSEWQRFTVSGAPAVTSILAGIIIATSTDAIEVWGAQLNQNPMEGGVTSSLTTYYPTTTAAYYAPRFDYNPSTLQPRGLLIEEQRTNGIRNNTMQGAVAGTPGTLPTNWITIGAGIGTLTQQIVGTGTSNGITYIDVRISGTTSTISFGISPESSTQISAASGQNWTSSIYLARVGGTTSNLAINQRVVERNGAGGAVGNTATNITSSLGTSLSRFSVTRTLVDATTAFVTTDVLFEFLAGVAIDITLRIGLPQLELGAFATSVIPTTTTALTRNADVASMTGTNFSSWYNASEGTIYANYRCFATSAFPDVFNISDGTNTNRQQQFIDASNGFTTFREIVSSVQQGVASQNSTMNTQIRSVGAYSSAGVVFTINGAAPTTNANVTHPTGLNRLNFGASGTGLSNYLNGHIQRLAYYPTRLPNATLQALTA